MNNTSCAVLPEGTGDVPFIPLVAALTLWPLIEIMIKSLVARFAPTFYIDLQVDVRKKYDVYFGTWVGLIFKPVALVACSAALVTTPASTDVVGLLRPLNTAEQWCWGCRVVVYLQEMSHYRAVPELMVHHLLSIFAVLAILQYNIPRRQLYLIWASLLSELINNARRLLKMHGKLTPRVMWWVSFAMAWSITLLRVPGSFIALLWTMQGGAEGIVLLINASCLLIYTFYMIKLSLYEFGRTRLLVVELNKPARLVVLQRYSVSLFSIAMVLGVVLTELSTLSLYEGQKSTSSSELELSSLSWVAPQSVVSGLAGAWVVPILGRWIWTPEPDVLQSRPSLSGGLVSAVLAVYLSPTVAQGVDRTALIACLVQSWPLLESFRLLGLYNASLDSEDLDEQLRSSRQLASKTSDTSKKQGVDMKHVAGKSITETTQQDWTIDSKAQETSRASCSSHKSTVPNSSISHMTASLVSGVPSFSNCITFSVLNGSVYFAIQLARWVLELPLYEAAYLTTVGLGLLALPILRRLFHTERKLEFAGLPITLQNLGISATAILLIMVGVATWMGYAPETSTSVDTLLGAAANGHETLWQLVSSWHFIASTTGISMCLVTALQFVD